jgi:hypothetical protein
MSLLCEVRKQDRIVNGELVKVGETCLLPNSLALSLEKNGGLVVWASPEEHLKHAAAKRKRRDDAELAKMEADAKAKKGKRAHG